MSNNYCMYNNLCYSDYNNSEYNKNITNKLNEYKIYIDSKHRDIIKYNNPFNFSVNFNNTESQYINNKLYTGTYQPIITKKFTNIKNIKITNILLPKTNLVNKDNDGIYTIDTDDDNYIIENRSITLNIDEFESNHILTTSNKNNDKFKLYPVQTINKKYVLWNPDYCDFTYSELQTKCINRLTFNILDENLEIFIVKDNNGDEIDFNRINTETNQDILNSIKEIYKYMQISMTLILENEEKQIAKII
jgi:hypothetical protein